MKHRKVRAFLIFLALSFLAWFISRLSQTYTHSVNFTLNYSHPPESMVLMESPPEKIGVRIRANGFQLLRYQLSPKTVEIDLKNVKKGRRGYYISPQSYRNQIEIQLRESADLLQIPADTFYMDFRELQSKTVPVRVDATLEFAQNYTLEGQLKLIPEQVHLLGPSTEIDSVLEVWTEPLILKDLNEDFQYQIGFATMEKLSKTTLSEDHITVSGTVFRFSETVVEVPVEVINHPEDMDIQTFPSIVGVLCRGKVAGLKEVKAADFRLMADYSAPEAETGRLMLRLEGKPDEVYEAQLLESSVEFIIKKE